MDNKNIEINNFPCGFLPMETQVAGHNFKDGKSTIGLLKHKDGSVLKPIVKKELGEKEVNFYQSLKSNQIDQLSFLCEFVPKYHGTLTLLINGQDVKFIKMDDVSRGLQKPCIMDIKIGRQTWEPNASNLKKEAEEKKYAASKKAFGFCIPGYQVYKLGTGELVRKGREFGKSLTSDTLPEVLREFLNDDEDNRRSRRLVGKRFEALLRRLKRWFQKQRVFHFYSSSILLLYDAAILEFPDAAADSLDLEASGDATREQGDSWVRAYMIDFAHACPSTDAQLDHNYLFGLTSLIDLLEKL